LKQRFILLGNVGVNHRPPNTFTGYELRQPVLTWCD